jgi:hypothetical protein
MILSFPDPGEREEVRQFEQKVLRDCLPHELNAQAMFQEAKADGFRLSPDTLIAMQHETLTGLALLWAGLPPHQADNFVEKLAAMLGPKWFAARARTRAMAERALAGAL